jgi:hypothetical protein
MTHGPEHHLEEAEHAQHAVHDPFNRRVALTMAIVAATLACVTLLSHRAHNDTLSAQIKANDNITERANVYSYYQAKKNRQYQAEANAQLLTANAEMLAGVRVVDLGSPVEGSGRGRGIAAEKARSDAKRWEENAKKWKEDAADLEKKGNALNPKIQEYEAEAEKHHHRSNYFDLGELGVQLALVLCTVAILARSRAFWYAGIAVGVVGLAVALSGFFVGGRGAESHPAPETTPKQEARLKAPSGQAGRLAGAAPAAGLDEAEDAQQHEDGAQRRHRDRADAGDALHRARLAPGDHPARPGGQEADDA